MYQFRFFVCCLLFCLFTSCSNGDKKSIIGASFGDTSFVNKNFSGNKRDFASLSNPCELLNVDQIAKLYNTTADKVLIDRPAGLGNAKSCRFLVKLSDADYDHVTGFIEVQAEISKADDPGGIAEATGGGTEWIEAWELKKTMSRSSEFLPNMGKAAIWNGAKRSLLIKFDGYTLGITAPGAAFNEKEKALNRDYKSIALALAKSTGVL